MRLLKSSIINMSNQEVYLDHAASAPLHPLVLDYISALYRKNLGNSSSIHRSGVLASVELEKGRSILAKRLNCRSEEIYFTSGATESNNLVFRGIFEANKNKLKNQIITSKIEHSSVTENVLKLKKLGCEIKFIDVDKNGTLNLNQLRELISDETLLVSVIHANNEIGVVQNLKEIGLLCKNYDVLFHSDGAQSFCKIPVDLQEMNIDLYSLSSHKIHGPKGIGALFIREGIEIAPQMIGGAQEGFLRAGTVPAELAASMAFASTLYNEKSLSHLTELKKYLVSQIGYAFPTHRLHGSLLSALPNILNFAIPGISGKSALQTLDQFGIRISVGSACHSGNKNPSSVLKALALTDEEAFEALRISWGLNTTREDIDQLIFCLKNRLNI